MKKIIFSVLVPDWADPEMVADDTCDYLDMNDYLAAGAIVDITDISLEQAATEFEYEADEDQEAEA
jgi:hypothetical protein